jgi:hypothetical protein
MKEDAFKNLMKMSEVPAGDDFTLHLMQRLAVREKERQLAADRLRHRLRVVIPLTLLLLTGLAAGVYALQGAIVQVAGSNIMRICQVATAGFILFGVKELLAISRRTFVRENVQARS